MSVIVTTRMQGDPARLEEVAAANRDGLKGIVETARRHGLIAHRFYGSDDGQIIVIDEWPDDASFRAFFEEAGPDIDALMGKAGVTGEPQSTALRKLETGDDVGWDA
jgi:quinol monooxygenase YgiN